MELGPYVNDLQRRLADAAENGTPDTRVVAERLAAGLDAATRVVLLDVLSAAVGEVTRDLAPGSVDMRLRGREIEFVVTQPNAETDTDQPPAATVDLEDASTSRTTLRLPDAALKVRVDEAASADGMSFNTWLVMPTYITPTTIDLAINLQVGGIEVVAGDRTDTVVTGSATSPAKAIDRRGQEATKVDFDGRHVSIVGPRPRIAWIGPNATDSVDVKVELPIGSRFTAEIAVGGVRTVGRLGATRIKSSMGSVDVEHTGDLWIRAAHGNAAVGAADGGVEISADHGQIRVGTVTGDAIFKAPYGSIRVGEAGGDLDAKLSYGDLEISTALASVSAKIDYGSIELGEVSSGSIQVESGVGAVTVGVRPGVPAWLDLSSKDGRVRNQIEGDDAPEDSEQAVAYLDEANQLADRIAVLDGGRIVADGTPDELKHLGPGGHIRLRFADAATLDAAFVLLDGSGRDDSGLALTVPSDGGVAVVRTALDRLDAAHLEVDDLSIHTPDLDDVFFALTGRTDTKGTES